MWYLYLDESGDLGFDFVNKRPSKYFTVTILAVSTIAANKSIISAVKKTLKRKLNLSASKKRLIHELKATNINQEIKEYFYKQLKDVKFGIYSITLNKRKVYEKLTREKDRVYNFIARKVLDELPLEAAKARVELIIDKSKGKLGESNFNSYIKLQLGARIDPNTPLMIYHKDSKDIPGLQAVDLFAWGIFRKYERNDTCWYSVYRDKILYDDLYL